MWEGLGGKVTFSPLKSMMVHDLFKCEATFSLSFAAPINVSERLLTFTCIKINGS